MFTQKAADMLFWRGQETRRRLEVDLQPQIRPDYPARSFSLGTWEISVTEKGEARH